MAKSVAGGDINKVLLLVQNLVPDDGDQQCTMLAVALAAACLSCGVKKEMALENFSEVWDDVKTRPPVPLDQLSKNN